MAGDQRLSIVKNVGHELVHVILSHVVTGQNHRAHRHGGGVGVLGSGTAVTVVGAAAAGHKAESHGQRQDQCKKLFHGNSPHFNVPCSAAKLYQQAYYTPRFCFLQVKSARNSFYFLQLFHTTHFSCVFFHFLRNNPRVYAQYAQRHSHFYHCKSQRFWRSSCRNCIKKTFALQNKPFCRANILHIVVSGHLLRFSASHSSSYIRSVEGTLSRSRTE